MKNNNLFVKLLHGLNVKYIRKLALNLYERHPFRDIVYIMETILFEKRLI